MFVCCMFLIGVCYKVLGVCLDMLAPTSTKDYKLHILHISLIFVRGFAFHKSFFLLQCQTWRHQQ